MTERAGLLVKHGGALAFLPASLVRSLLPSPRLTKIPWDTAQIALVSGEVVAVLELGEPSGVLVLCEVLGQTFALSGLRTERVGVWPEAGAGVRVDGVDVPALDLDHALVQFQNSGSVTQERHHE